MWLRSLRTVLSERKGKKIVGSAATTLNLDFTMRKWHCFPCLFSPDKRWCEESGGSVAEALWWTETGSDQTGWGWEHEKKPAGQVRNACQLFFLLKQIILNDTNTFIFMFIIIMFYAYVTLEHKTNLKSLGYICSNSQKYIVWVKIIHFSFMPNIFRTFSKDHVPWRYFVHFLP